MRLDYLYKNIHYLNEREKRISISSEKARRRPRVESARESRGTFSDQQVPENFGYTNRDSSISERSRRNKRAKSEHIPTNVAESVVENIPSLKRKNGIEKYV